jgi:hypothetical protein
MLCSVGKKGFAPQQPLQVILTGPEITADTIKPVFPKSCDGTYSFSSGIYNCTSTYTLVFMLMCIYMHILVARVTK